MRVRDADLWDDDVTDHPLDNIELRQLPLDVVLDDDYDDEGISFRSVHQEPELLTWRGLAELSQTGGFRLVRNDKRQARPRSP